MKFPIFIIGLTLLHSVLGDDPSEEENEEALDKIQEQWILVNHTNIYIMSIMPQALNKFNVVYNKKNITGNLVIGRVFFKIDYLDKQYKKEADLQNCGPKVYNCIEKVRQDTTEITWKEHMKNFYIPFQKLGEVGYDEINDETHDWNNDYHYSLIDYANAYENTVKELRTCKDKKRISFLIDRFENQSKEMLNLLNSIFIRIDIIVSKYELTMEELSVTNNKKLNKMLDQTIIELKQCLTLKSNIFS